MVVPTVGHSFEGDCGVRLVCESVNSRGLREEIIINMWPTKRKLTVNTAPEVGAYDVD